MSAAARAVALDIFKAFERIWHAAVLHNLRSYGVSGQMFDLISFFLSNRWLWVVLDEKSSQECPVNAEVPQRSILGPTLLLLCINDLPDDVICNIANYADDTTLYSKSDQASDLRQLLELTSKLWTGARNDLLISMLEKQLVSFDYSNNTGAINGKMDGSFLDENSSDAGVDFLF